MNTQYQELLLKIFAIIDYKDDKQAFLDNFAQLIERQALITLMQSLPAEKQPAAQKNLAAAKTAEKATEVVKKYFTKDEVKQAVDQAANNAIVGWMEALMPSLNDSQKNKLSDLFSSLA